MKKPPLSTAFLLATVCFFTLTTRGEEAPSIIKFSEPGKPGTVKIMLGRGDLWVQGADSSEVVVKSSAKAVAKSPRKDGLRVLSASSSFALTEKDNVVTLDATSDMMKSGAEFRLTVPRSTSIVVQNSWGGEITCSNLAGDLEIKSMNGEIRLNDVSGGALVETMNGEITASIRELRENKSLSFTSWNGAVVLRVPSDAKASVRLRTQNGSVLTDFEESALVTKTESTAGLPRPKRTTTIRTGGKVISDDVHEAIRDAAQSSAAAVQEAIIAVKESVGAAREGLEAARRASDRDRASRGNRNENSDAKPAPAIAPMAPMAPLPPKAPMPTITGGKLVTGTLNGGGPEISVSTMNGDVTLRKLDPK